MSKVKSSLVVHEDKEVKAIERGIWAPDLFDWRDVIEDYLVIARRRFDNKLSMFKLQMGLLQDINQSEKTIQFYRRILKDPNIAQEHLGKKPTDDERQDLERYLQGEKLIRKALKEIADGHLWQLLDYNREVAQCLGRRPDTGFIGLESSGAWSEVYNWADAITTTTATHFLLNDLSNYARIGDAIIRDHDGSIEVREIKSSHSTRKKRAKKQKSIRENFVSLANNGRGESEDGKALRIVHSPVEILSRMAVLEKVLKRSERNGVVSHSVYPYLKVVCADWSILAGIEQNEAEFKRVIDLALDEWKNKDDSFFILDSNIRERYSPNMTPLALYPIREQYIADILLQRKTVFFLFNFDVFFRAVEAEGWAIRQRFDQIEEPDSRKDAFCILVRRGHAVEVPWTLANQVTYELLPLKSFVGIMDFLHDTMPSDLDEVLLISFKGNVICGHEKGNIVSR